MPRVRAGRFQQGTEPGPVLEGKTIGLIGLGRIGTRMAAYCRALDMQVLAWSQNLSDEAASAAGAILRIEGGTALPRGRGEPAPGSLRANPGILAAADLALMRPGAILVNTARAQLVEEAALMDAVRSGRLIVALDVFHHEPLPADNPLTRAHNAVLTPHLGYGVIEVYREYYRQCIENALAFLDGKPIRVLQSARS